MLDKVQFNMLLTVIHTLYITVSKGSYFLQIQIFPVSFKEKISTVCKDDDFK